MNRTTRIKTAQAPRMYNIDLTDQLDGETQTFTLEKPLNEQCTYYVIWNGTTYRNDPQNTWFSFNETWDELTTYFDHAPTPGAHRSLILVVSEAADGSDVGTEVYMDSEHQDFVQIETDGAKVTSINGKTVSGLSPEELQAIYDAIDDVSNDVSAVSRDLLAEVLARGNADANLQAQIDAITASSDVKDIVGTKAELDQYDTSTLGDKDIIKVLQDETQNNATTYYRWNDATSQFTLIGQEGPYYTKSAVDALLLDKADKATTYTKTEVDALISAIPQPTVFTGATSTDAGTSGLVPAPAAGDEGKYLKGDGTWGTVQGGIPTNATFWGASYDAANNKVSGNIALNNSSTSTVGSLIIWGSYSSISLKPGTNGRIAHSNDIDIISNWNVSNKTLAIRRDYIDVDARRLTSVADPTAAQDAATKNYVDNLTISYAALNGTAAPTTATEGKYVGQLYYDTTNEQLYFLKAIDDTVDPVEYTWEAVGSGSSINVVQTTGTSTTDVMSQAAATDMLFVGNNKSRIAIGPNVNRTDSRFGKGFCVNFNSADGYSHGSSSIVIGDQPRVSGGGTIALGNNTYVLTDSYSSNRNRIVIGNNAAAGTNNGDNSANSIAIGYMAKATSVNNSIALGSYSQVARPYTLSIGSGAATNGTRFIANVTDPTSPQDAATKNYVDTAVASAGAATYTNTEFNNLWENA